MSSKDFLANLKVGDKVIVTERFDDAIRVITRLTKTQIIVGQSAKFWKKDGRLVGCNDWSSNYIEEVTEEKARVIHKKTVIKNIKYLASNVTLDLLSIDALESVLRVLRKAKEIGAKDGQSK